MSSYYDVTWALRTGTNTQTTINAFRNSVNTNYNFTGVSGGKLLSTLFSQHTTSGLINKFVLHIEFPNGLYKINSKGKQKSEAVNFLVEWKKSTDSTWNRLTARDANGDLYSTDANNGDWVKVGGKTGAKILKAITVDGLDLAIYNIRVRRSTHVSSSISKSDKAYAVFVSEVLHADLAYPNTALLALKLLATEQLSGQLPNIQTLVKGIKLRVPDIQQSGSNVPFEDVYWEGLGTNLAPLNNCTDPDNDANSTTGWTVSTGTGVSEAGGETGFRYKLTSPVGGDGQVIQTSAMSLTEGTTYKFTFSAGADVGDSYRVSIWDADSSVMDYFIWAQAGQGAGTWDNHIFYWTCGNTSTQYKIYFNSVNPNDVAYFDNFSFKEVKSVDFTTENWAKLSDWSDCTWDGISYVTQYSSNPAYCLRDFLLNTRYGLGEFITTIDIDDTTIDTSAKKQWQMVDPTIVLYEPGGGLSEKLIWAVGNQEHRNEMNFVIEGPGDPANVFRQMARIGRMLVFYSNGYIKFKYEEDESSVQLFTMGNVVENSFNLSFMPHTQIPNIMEVQFTDSNDKYKMNTMEVVDEDEWALGKPRRKKTLSLKGVTNTNQVLRETKFALNSAKYRRMAAEWKAPLHAVHCEPGDVVDFQHDVTQWGWGGKAVGGSSTTIQLDKDIPPEVVAAPASYTIKVQHSNDTIETFLLSGTDTDYTLTIQGTFVTTPVEDTVYLIGQADTTIFPFRIMGISITDDEELQIQAIEHEAAIYDDLGLQLDTKEYSELPNPSIVPGNVTNLTVTETRDKLGIAISFNAPSQTRSDGTDEDDNRATDYTWHRGDIYISVDNINFDKIGTAYEAVNTFNYTDVSLNQTYYIRVYSASRYVTSNTYEEFSIKVIGLFLKLVPPTGLELFGQGNNTAFPGKDAKFVWRPRLDVVGIGGVDVHDAAGGIDVWGLLKDFHIQILSGNTLLREEYVSKNDPTYIYTYEKNFEDNNGSVLGTFTIRVRQRTIGNKLSSAASLTVTSDTPQKPANITTAAEEDGVRFAWDEATISDFDYYEYRTKVASGSWSAWKTIYDNIITRWLTGTEMADQGQGQSIIYVEVRTVDLFGTTSSATAANDTCDNFKGYFTVSPTPGKGHFTTVASAIEGLSSAGGTIVLKEGKHQLPTTQITLPDKDLTFIGDGRELTKLIINTGAGQQNQFYAPSRSSAYTFRDFTASCTDVTNNIYFLSVTASTGAPKTTSKPKVTLENIKLAQIDQRDNNQNRGFYARIYPEGKFHMRDCLVSKGDRAMHIIGHDIDISRNTFDGLVIWNIYAQNSTASQQVGMNIEGNRFVNFRRTGIYVYNTTTNPAQGCNISKNTFLLRTATTTASDMYGPDTVYGIFYKWAKAGVIEGNNFILKNASTVPDTNQFSLMMPIYVSVADNVSVANNTCIASLNSPETFNFIRLNYCTKSTVLGNTGIMLNATSNGSYYGVYLDDEVQRCIVSDNNLSFNNRANDTGIYLSSGHVSVDCKYNTGRGNLIYNAGTGVNNNASYSDVQATVN
jgi:parallel beta-helix repeat protein